ncbi:MAG: hypothetical protein KKC24_15790 [Gammaproteobacteria bacterium]|uniref:hypothetical protein n=1 Tax=Pseudomonas sp. FSL W5-0299 TaxID=1917484 RepID=UPI00098BBE13|nr:hypothetical protein [Pseudomonas sp. FSL W5-0299]MBU0524285.1 hypothetical protein [Gammaproteobacteria bacterium]MBU0820305.1 hypothetical protein [Gammaproteobacteria bacterium]MBU0841629.1 hypothetical protein [Gammaproteobacteria bacterium]MBU1841253.1 hypothetical protein [Gammaproteobacteria bacterium]OOL39398.1 hypothetical protein BOO94_00195 [Pseudomonas sp. FSL W5-0299]
MSKAEEAFREAFERLKKNEPIRVAKGSIISQNLIAKEAGTDPTALKKARFPSLIAEIQHWISANALPAKVSTRQKNINQRAKNRTFRDQLEEIKKQRDLIASQLVEADAKILELTLELERYRSSVLPPNVTRLR